jgi:hypothetical protein
MPNFKPKIDRYTTISKKLRDQNKSNDYFEIMLNNLTIEDIIALKLELAYRTIGFPIYGFPIWRATNFIVKDAMLKFVFSITDSKSKMRKILGLNLEDFLLNVKKYKTADYFLKEKGDGTN